VSCILCIDDEHPDLELRKALLESAGYRVLAASSGREGIQLFRESKEALDAVVLDYWMAGMNGLAVAREMKRLRPQVPIIMLTALFIFPEETIGVVDRCLGKGEIEPNDLLSTLATVLENGRKAKTKTCAMGC
jgi:CheY-like chemotaxis protein